MRIRILPSYVPACQTSRVSQDCRLVTISVGDRRGRPSDERVLIKRSCLAQSRGFDWGHDQGHDQRLDQDEQLGQSYPKHRWQPAGPRRHSAVGEPALEPRMSVVLPIATASLVYVVLGAVLIYALVTHALRAAERAAMADLDRELRELVSLSRAT